MGLEGGEESASPGEASRVGAVEEMRAVLIGFLARWVVVAV
jgi:hypothetical protein